MSTLVADLRSDTITRPSAGMRRAMADAEVGDDVFGDDPTVLALETRVAALLGKPAAVFVVSGSLGNLLGVGVQVRPGTELLCDVQAHLLRHELGGHAMLHGVSSRTYGNDHGRLDPARVAELLTPDAGPYGVSTSVVASEQTAGEPGGLIQPWDALAAVSAMCADVGVGRHLDGARLWNAHVATGIAMADYAGLFDTVSVCLSKGLGAPIGSVLVGPAELIEQARVLRKRLGAGWRQAGILAAAGMYALDHNIARLADDHEAARALAAELPDQPVPETNMIMIDTGDHPADVVCAQAEERGVRVLPTGPHTMRAVTSLEVSVEGCAAAGRILAGLLR